MTWSLSRLKTYETCHAKFKYQYIDLLPRGSSGPAAERGVKIHKEIEDSIKGIAPAPAEADFVSSNLGAIKLSGVPAFAEYTIKLDREWKQVISGDYWYHGIIDLLVRPTETSAEVWDWKTGKIYTDHDQQKELYAVAVFRSFPEVDEVVTKFAYLDQGIIKERTYHLHHVEPAMERWTARVTRMEQEEEFIPMPGYHCRWCNYSNSQGGPCRF